MSNTEPPAKPTRMCDVCERKHATKIVHLHPLEGPDQLLYTCDECLKTLPSTQIVTIAETN
jgi:hypothetical protein